MEVTASSLVVDCCSRVSCVLDVGISESVAVGCKSSVDDIS